MYTWKDSKIRLRNKVLTCGHAGGDRVGTSQGSLHLKGFFRRIVSTEGGDQRKEVGLKKRYEIKKTPN